MRAIRWAIRQLRFEGAAILGLARQLGATWNTKSIRVCKSHLMILLVLQGFRYWELTSTCGTTRTDAAVAHVSSPRSWT